MKQALRAGRRLYQPDEDRQLQLPAREYHRVFKLAWTIADLAGCEKIRPRMNDGATSGSAKQTYEPAGKTAGERNYRSVRDGIQKGRVKPGLFVLESIDAFYGFSRD